MGINKEAIVIIGFRSEENGIEFARKRGLFVIFLNTRISIEDALEADLPLEVDLNDEIAVIQKIIDISAKYNIRGVFTLNEYRVVLAAKICEALGLTWGLSVDAALNCRQKKRTRELLLRQGVGSAQFVVIVSAPESLSALQKISCPVIVKPSNDAGSNFVARCDSPEQVWDAAAAITASKQNWVGQAFDREILIEEFLDGPEFSVESCTVASVTTVLAITQKKLAAPPSTTEMEHLVPAPLSESERLAITALVSDALKALGVSRAVTHTEVKLTSVGPKIIEVNARPGGDRIAFLVKATTGVDLRELSMHLCLGGGLDTFSREEVTSKTAAIRFFLAGQSGVVSFHSPELMRTEPGVRELQLYVEPGEKVSITSSNYNRLGYCMVNGDTIDDVYQTIDRVSRNLEITINRE